MIYLRKGDITPDGSIQIIDEDRLCFRVLSEKRGASGIRTLSKEILEEFIAYEETHPSASANEVRDELSGVSKVDKFEYGYCSTLLALAKLNREVRTKEGRKNSLQSNLNLPLQQIFYGAPGTGKSHGIKKQEDKFAEVIRTTFHPDSDYSTFVGAYKPTMKRAKKCVIIDKEEREITPTVTNDEYEERISFTFVKQAFLKAYIAAWKGQKEGKNILLVIEEINRGNCAQIFGDLFQLLDREESGYSSYPISADEDLRQVLEREFVEIEDIPAKVKSGEELLLPRNLYIWATMNTSDQSLFPIDSAFKRRWDWKYVPIANKEDKDYSIEVDGMLYDWWDFLSKVNTAIGKTTESEDKKLGYFFCKADKKAIPSGKENNVISADRFVSKAIFYIWNDVMKDYDPNEVTFQYKVTSEEGKNELVTLSLMSYKEKGENGEEQDVTISFSDFFQGAGDINLNTVKRLMDNLKIKTKERKEVKNSGSDESATADGFLVRFKDGTVINKKRPVETFIESIKYIAELTSYEEIAGVGITHDGYHLLSKERQNGTDSRQLGDNGEWWLMTRLKHRRKVEVLQKISDDLMLGLEITKPEEIEEDEENLSTPNSRYSKNFELNVTLDGEEVNASGDYVDVYLETLRRLGFEQVMALNVQCHGQNILSLDEYQSHSYRRIGDYYAITFKISGQIERILKEVAVGMNRDIQVEFHRI